MLHIPLLTFIVILYNVLVFVSGNLLHETLWTLDLVSGARWSFQVNHLLLSASVILLYVEIFKATRTSAASIVDHVFSMVLFIVCLVEFMVIPQVGDSIFFVIMLMTLLDVIAGFTITISTARRDMSLGGG